MTRNKSEEVGNEIGVSSHPIGPISHATGTTASGLAAARADHLQPGAAWSARRVFRIGGDVFGCRRAGRHQSAVSARSTPAITDRGTRGEEDQ